MNAVTKHLDQCPPGQWKVLRVSGIVEVTLGRPTIAAVRTAIGASTLDTVNLRGAGGRATGVVMFVDDLGHDARKPVNPGATALYRLQCRPGTTHQIVGDVAIVNDADFA